MDASPEAPAIALRRLRKSFEGEVVLNGIDLTVARGETVAILGRSGTGKSVLLKLVVGLHRPDDGSIAIHGRDVTTASRDELNQIRRCVGFLFQEAALYDALSVEENVAFPLNRHRAMNARERTDRVRDLLSLVGMEEDSAKMPAQISGGMKKRVGLARALALDPDILLFDEPTAGLDPITAGEIEDLILELRRSRELSCIVVTHDLHGARVVADRFAMMDGGRILADGTFEDLKNSRDEMVSRFFKDAA